MRRAENHREWLTEMGVEEWCGDAPVNWFAQKAKSSAATSHQPSTINHQPSLLAPSAAVAQARALADSAQTLDALEASIRAFDGCRLKATAQHTVFADGNRAAKIVLIGEAPGAQEDQTGVPFCGVSGQLLDKMLQSIGLTREQVLITNTLYWRPPGNRAPSKEELAICQPFVEKLIALVRPQLLVLAGGIATQSVLQNTLSLSRLRGKLHPTTNPYLTDTAIPALVTYHPSYLLRSPAQKRLAWADLLLLQHECQQRGIL